MTSTMNPVLTPTAHTREYRLQTQSCLRCVSKQLGVVLARVSQTPQALTVCTIARTSVCQNSAQKACLRKLL